FMENLFNPWNLPALRARVFPSPIPVATPLQQVATADIASVATLAIERPREFAGERIPLASDELTAERAADILSRATGRRFHAQQLQAGEVAPSLRALFAWLEQTDDDIDIPCLHARYPEVKWRSYAAWLATQRDRFATLCSQPHGTARE